MVVRRTCNAKVGGSIPPGGKLWIVAQMVERLLSMQEVVGSIPTDSKSPYSTVVVRRTCNAKVGGSIPPGGTYSGPIV